MSTLPTIFNSSNTKIFSTNEQNIVEANKDNIVEADAQIREVIPKGYLLSNINLSTVPDVIADAILQAMSDTKDAVLSDSLLSTLRTDLENLDDGVYKKTYIDNTITYLEDLLTSKVDAETVASIADSKIATASEGFAATSSVNLLTSRVDSSESAIITLAETVNTKDTARANQISELKASIDDTFSGYSEAIDLVVESDGSVRAKKIEDLRVEFESEIGLVNASITDTNELIVEKDGEWKASSMKLITNPYGGITGYSFQDGSGLKSNFTINADTFKISNSTNTYTPFSIVDNNLLFNGRVTFSNITGGDSILTVDNVQDAINNNVTSIDGGKIVTNAAFVNNLNATGGIVADYVNANEINGLVINGGIINGARINGAVIKASYLDLDGELEVLTNYHISVATYNASPSTYSDAVYISADNEYRIPSWSTIKEANKSVALHSVGASSTSLNRSYNTANVGHNNKCVNIRPTLNYNGTVLTITVNTPGIPFNVGESTAHSYATSLYCFGVLVGTFKLKSYAYLNSMGEYNEGGTGVNWYVNGVQKTSFSTNIYGIVFTATVSGSGNYFILTVSMTANNQTISSNYSSSVNILSANTTAVPYEERWQQSNSYSVDSSSMFTTSSSMTINNMI